MLYLTHVINVQTVSWWVMFRWKSDLIWSDLIWSEYSRGYSENSPMFTRTSGGQQPAPSWCWWRTWWSCVSVQVSQTGMFFILWLISTSSSSVPELWTAEIWWKSSPSWGVRWWRRDDGGEMMEVRWWRLSDRPLTCLMSLNQITYLILKQCFHIVH